MNFNAKLLKKFSKLNPAIHFKKSYTMIKWDLLLGCKFGIISTNELM